jgi:hypothetical protein
MPYTDLFFQQRLYDERRKQSKLLLFCPVLNTIGFSMTGKLIRSHSVLVRLRFRIHRYVAASKNNGGQES